MTACCICICICTRSLAFFVLFFSNIGRFPTLARTHPSPEACVLGPARGESEASWHGLAGAAAGRRYSLLGWGRTAV